ncbi:MAG TPA: VIT domain-containing protein [Myxococcales bacterium]|nr:VIT domain-containing protein [Myxococcales bacterium]
MTVAIPLVDIPSGARRALGSLEAGKHPLPLEGVQLRARVVDRVAEVTVEQRFGNPFSDPIEAVYVFPLAGGCAVSRFEMQIGSRTLRAKVEARGEARRQYAEALQQGKRAALLEQERDDVFTVQVGNIAPGESIVARLTYSERLPFFEDGRTELRLPLVVAPRYVGGEELQREQAGKGVANDTTTVPDASRISPPRLARGFDPKVALDIQVELFGGASELSCSQHAMSASATPESARISLSREREPLDRDFVLRWQLSSEKVESRLLVHHGYALLSLVPPARQGFLGVPRDVVFVLDRSGSMQGPKMASAARACALLLRTLGPRDRFAVQAFDNVIETMPGGLQAADEAGTDRGEKWLRGVFSRGGTELDLALAEALALLAGRTEPLGRAAVVVLLTDGQVGDESSALKRVRDELRDARVFTVGVDTAVNAGFLKRLAALGGGTSTLVEPGGRLEEALQAVGREIGTPLVTDLRVTGEIAQAAPARLPDLFAGRASAVFFRHSGGPVKVAGRLANGDSYEVELEPREAPLLAIEHLWARSRVTDLEDEYRATRADAIKQEIVALSVKHAVLTRFTAFVVIDEEFVSGKGAPRTVVQPVEMPAEWELPEHVMVAAGRMMPMATASRAPAGVPPPVRAMAKRGMLSQTVSTGALLHSGGGRAGFEPEPATPAQKQRVRDTLEAFLAAFADSKAGRGPAEGLEQARVALLRALGESLALATAVPLLQAFLRSAALELISALSQGGATAELLDRHTRALLRARDEARIALGEGKPAAGSFWEASI